MTRKQLVEQIFLKHSYLCVGLDTDVDKIPLHLQSHPDAVFEFNKAIIDATKQYCISYKINTAFYEAMGVKGWEVMERTVNYIPETHFKIADAKRGDIGNTSAQYAKAFFETLNFDAITVAPYMGSDSLKPFLEYQNKTTIVLGLTSNAGAKDFELQKMLIETHILNEGVHITKKDSPFLYEWVIDKVREWGTIENLMFVIGATRSDELKSIRNKIPDHFLLIPGVGAQGGDLHEISTHLLNKDAGILVNSSRSIIYASGGEDFAEKAKLTAKDYQGQMQSFLSETANP
ncbi:MAG: orotidine-5'-phosphate decarboxylase [Bacteroidota bacterium]|nr:orotidine-5'-phosphate decarboxylase [Bacteroidota bacterium]